MESTEFLTKLKEFANLSLPYMEQAKLLDTSLVQYLKADVDQETSQVRNNMDTLFLSMKSFCAAKKFPSLVQLNKDAYLAGACNYFLEEGT